MNCFKLRIKKPTKYTEADGYTYLDLEPGSDLRSTKVASELMETSKIKFDFNQGFSISASEKNFDILSDYFHGNVIDNNYNPIDVDVITGSKITSNNRLYVVAKNTAIDIKLIFATDHWAYALQNKKLNTVKLDKFQVSHENVKAKNAEYLDSLLSFPMVNYGFLLGRRGGTRSGPDRERNTAFYNFLTLQRPWFRNYILLEKMFCEIGYEFISPIMKSSLGKTSISYLMDRNFGLIPEKIANMKVELESGPNNSIPFLFSKGFASVIPFNIVSDIGGNWRENECYSGGIVKVSGNIKMRLAKKGNEVKISLANLIYKDNDGYGLSNAKLLHTEVASDDNQDFEFDFDIDHFLALRELPMAFFIERKDKTIVNLSSGSSILIEGVRKFWDTGEEYEINSFIDSEYNCLEYFKGIVHEKNLKLYTDTVNRKLYALQPHEINYYGELIEGFMLEKDYLDFEPIQDITSDNVETPKNDDPRYLRIQYKGDGDDTIQELKLKEPIYSRKIDFGQNKTNDDTLELENPFFEATYSAIQGNNSLQHFGPIIKSKDLYSFWDINPRILIDFGPCLQDLYNAIIEEPDGTLNKLIPTAAQYCPIKIGLPNDYDSDKDYRPHNNIFSNEKDLIFTDSYEFLYKRQILEDRLNSQINYLCNISPDLFNSLTFRNYVYIRHYGRLVKTRLYSIEDFAYCSNLLTSVTFIPEKSVSNVCEIFPEPPVRGPECLNAPVIVYTEQDGCWTFSIAGSNDDVIVDVIFEYLITEAGGWILMAKDTLISATLCALIEPFTVRATVKYEECDDKKTPYITITPCLDVLFSINCIPELNIALNKMTFRGIIYTPDVNTIYSVIVFEYKLGSDLDWSTYIGDNIIVENDFIYFRATVQIGNCPTIDITSECFDFNIPTADCNDIDIKLICEPVSPGCYTFKQEGFIPASLGDYDTFIKYRCETEGSFGEWLSWDGVNPVCCSRIQARMFVHFCNHTCPMYCTDITECSTETVMIICDMGILTATYSGDDTGCEYFWDGPNGFNAVGNPIEIPKVEGDYRVRVFCGNAVFAQYIYNHDVPDAGPDSTVIMQ